MAWNDKHQARKVKVDKSWSVMNSKITMEFQESFIVNNLVAVWQRVEFYTMASFPKEGVC